jgi:hypothetical protein
MRQMKNIGMILLVIAFTCSLAYGGSGSPSSSQSGQPPYGMAYQSDAAGTKLNGVICIEYYNVEIPGGNPINSIADAKIVLRLQKGSGDPVLLYGTAYDVLINDIIVNQMAVTAAMAPQIIDVFFGGDDSLTVSLKSAKQFSQVDVPPSAFYAVFDVELAVK